MDNNQPNLKKIAFLIMGGVMAVFLLSWLWRWYHTGKIIITTSNSYNTIALTKTNSGNDQSTAPSFKAHSELSVNVGTGEYVASVTGNSVATIQTINLKPRETLRYTINPINATGVEPVAYENAQDITTTAHQLTYLDVSSDDENEDDSNTLSKIDDQNNLTEKYASQQFQTVKWASSSFGVGQDDEGHLYTIANRSVRPLKVPFSYRGKVVNFDVSPGKRIYMSYGKDVYAGSQTGGFKKIYTATSSKPALAAGINQVAVADSKYGENASNIPKSLLATINASGKVSKNNVEAERSAWSPNGQYLVTLNQSNPTIYDAALHTAAVIPTKSVVGQFAWLNNSTLLYTINDQLWTYSLPGQKAQLLANMPLSASITGLYVSDDKSYIYLTTFDSNSQDYAIKRIGLKGQKVPDYIYKLQDALPISPGSDLLSLINFSGPPTILVQAAPGTNLPAEPQQAIQELQGLGFDTSKLRFDVEQIEP